MVTVFRCPLCRDEGSGAQSGAVPAVPPYKLKSADNFSNDLRKIQTDRQKNATHLYPPWWR